LAPVRKGRARVYTQADQQRLLLILKGRKLGFTVSEISQMLVAAEDRRGPPHSLKIPRGKCLEQIELLERQLNDTHEALAVLRQLTTC
jgi:DNA-binding transcriptional MerR regulator